jgi:hypothetical protein
MIAQFAFVMLLSSGEAARDYITFIPNEWKDYIFNNKFKVGIIVYILGSTIQSSVASSGAFEVLLNNNLIFSKLKTGTVPQVYEIEKILSDAGALLQRR